MEFSCKKKKHIYVYINCFSPKHIVCMLEVYQISWMHFLINMLKTNFLKKNNNLQMFVSSQPSSLPLLARCYVSWRITAANFQWVELCKTAMYIQHCPCALVYIYALSCKPNKTECIHKNSAQKFHRVP